MILADGYNPKLSGIENSSGKPGPDAGLARVHSLFSTIFKEVILVVDDPAHVLDIDALVVTGLYTPQSVLAGIHAGLFHACFDWSYVVAGDLCFAGEKVIGHLLAQRADGKQVVIPKTRNGLEPPAGLYHKSGMPRIEAGLEKNLFQIEKIFKPDRIRQIRPEILESLDTGL